MIKPASGSKRLALTVLLATVLVAAGQASGNANRDAAVMAVLETYLVSLNALDLEAHVATYRFPHYRHSIKGFVVWQTAAEAIPLLNQPKENRREQLRAVLEPDWDRSEWTRRDIVQGDDEKVHVVTTFERLRKDGSVIKAFDSLYVLTFADGVWKIKGRSSFAP